MKDFMNGLGRTLGLSVLCLVSAFTGAIAGVMIQEAELTDLKSEKLRLEIENAKIKNELDIMRKL